MPKGLKNWTYRDVRKFLTQKSFYLSDQKSGSHEYWISADKKYVVNVNRITGQKSYPPKTLATMISQSGIDKKEWRNWAEK